MVIKKLKFLFVISLLYALNAAGADAGSPVVQAVQNAETAFKKSEYKHAEELYNGVLTNPSFATLDDKTKMRANINFAETLLARGKYQKGHEHFDARLRNTAANRKPLKNSWDGKCANDTCAPLLIRGEHGIGDTFFFLRYMKQLHEQGIPVVVRERGFLKPLLSRQPYISKVITADADEDKTQFTFDVYAMSLPRYVSKNGLSPLQTAQDIPYATGYIEPKVDLVEKWKSQFSDKQKLHVLIGAYRASKNVAGECRFLKRDCAIAALIKSLAKPNVKLYHPCGGEHRPIKRSEYERLKQEGNLRELDELDIVEDADWSKIVLLGADPSENFDKYAFEDTAAAMCAADYVISVDTSTAMLAGGLGVKNFGVLLPKESDWRWGEGQPSTTPFFANARLFWQKEQDDWSAPLESLSEAVGQASAAKAETSQE